MNYSFDPHLSRASTIPSTWYRDPRVLEEEKRRIFARTWQLVGRVDQIPSAGSYFTTSIADEPVLIVRGKDDEVRAMSNVCRHRAGPVASGEGKKSAFQCGYHGWTYALDGQLLTTPEFDGVEDFDKKNVCLPRFRVELWGPLIFVALDRSAPPLAEFLGDISEKIGHIDLKQFRLAHRKEWFVDCNWKVYVDNYLEGYHIPIVHPGLFKELDYAQYRTETRRFYSIQHSPVKKPDRIRVENPDDEAQYFWVFPNLMLNVYPDNFSTNLILPLGVDRTVTIFDWFFRDPESDATRRIVKETVEFSDEIQVEDIGICEAVQRGLKSSTYSQGRYSVKRENGVHHFHGLLASFLSD